MPYIEKRNGNICIQAVALATSDDAQIAVYRSAIGYYNKALLGLQILFKDDLITEASEAAKFI